ncbi:hypothetical protein BLOT_014015 [Blomia tropicalis]|nr:hypothetical protein BLOT_014015 [Blomia tropicalis]
MLRFFSKRFRRRDGARPLGQENEQNQKNSIHCKVLLLDGNDLTLYMRKKSIGDELFSRVCDNIGLYVESDYFGLQYTDTNTQSHWLDNTKEIRKQVKIGPPYSFRLRVKFYCSDPNTLRDEFTRYLFFLQIKQDILTGRLPCTNEVASSLCALALQSEFGDNEEEEHDLAFVSEFRFVPGQTEELEKNILEEWRQLRPSATIAANVKESIKAALSMDSATAESNYLNKAKWLEMYGVDMHICFELNDNRIGKSILSQSPLVTFSHVSNYRFGGSGHVTSSGHKYGTILLIAFFFKCTQQPWLMFRLQSKDGNEYSLGLTPTGVLVFEGATKIGLFFWPKIKKLDLRGKKLILVVVEDDDDGHDEEHTFVFRLVSSTSLQCVTMHNIALYYACVSNVIRRKRRKHLWKCAIEHHAFFRLKSQPLLERSKTRQSFVRMGSRFRYSGRTQFQAIIQQQKTAQQESKRNFERRPSQRFSRRSMKSIAPNSNTTLPTILANRNVGTTSTTTASVSNKANQSVDRSNSSSSKSSPNTSQAIKASLPPAVSATEFELVKTQVAEDFDSSSGSEKTLSKHSNTGKSTSFNNGSSPEQRLDSLIKSLSKADAIATKNTSQDSGSEFSKSASSSSTVINVEKIGEKDEVNDNECVNESLKIIEKKRTVNNFQKSFTNIKVVNNNLNGINGKIKEANEEIIVNDLASVSNNNVSNKSKVIPEKKCNILRAKELEQRRQSVKVDIDGQQQQSITCNIPKSLDKSSKDAGNNHFSNIGVKNGIVDNNHSRTVPMQTFVGHQVSNTEIKKPTLKSKPKQDPETSIEEDDDDEMPLIGNGVSTDPNNITIIPVYSGASNVSTIENELRQQTNVKSEIPPIQFLPTNPFVNDITNSQIVADASTPPNLNQFARTPIPIINETNGECHSKSCDQSTTALKSSAINYRNGDLAIPSTQDNNNSNHVIRASNTKQAEFKGSACSIAIV